MSSTGLSFDPPRGMRDFYPDDMSVRNALFDAWVKAARLFGFAQYDSCVVETLDLLKRKSGEEIVDQIYAFADKSGRELALRAEMTPTLARMVAARQATLSFPLKWFAIAQCFRYERMTRGRKREHYQWNMDIVGEPSVSAEAEVIAAAVHALALIGLGAGEFRVHFSSRALLSDLLLALGIAKDHHPATFLALDKRGKVDDGVLRDMMVQAGLSAADVEKVFSLLGIHRLEDAAAILPPESRSLADVLRFHELARAYGLAGVLQFDISVIRGLAYYTGLVFEAFDVNRKFRAIFGGGRYDNLLMEVGGKPATGVGLGFGDVVVAELLADLGKNVGAGLDTQAAVGFMQEEQRLAAVTAACAFRAKGWSVDLALAPEKAKSFFTRVGRGRFRQAIYVGPDDVAGGTIRVKDLLARSETVIAFADLAPGPA